MNELERPDANVLFVWRAEVLTAWGIAFIVVLSLAIVSIVTIDASAWCLAFATIPLLFCILGLVLLKLRWQFWTYKLTPDTLEMSHGWLVRHRRIVSRNRIQHVDFNSGPVGRKFDLVHVVVHTAGATVGTIPGVRSARAEQLRNDLMSGPKAL